MLNSQIFFFSCFHSRLPAFPHCPFASKDAGRTSCPGLSLREPSTQIAWSLVQEWESDPVESSWDSPGALGGGVSSLSSEGWLYFWYGSRRAAGWGQSWCTEWARPAGERRGAEGSWHGLPERDSLWTVRVVRGGVVLFSFLFLVRKAVVPDRYPVSQGTVSGPASGCSVTRVCEACPFQGEAGGHRRVPRCSCVQKHKLLVAPGSLWWSHQNCGQHRGAGGLTSA